MNTLPGLLVAACLMPIAYTVGSATTAALTAIAHLVNRIETRKRYP